MKVSSGINKDNIIVQVSTGQKSILLQHAIAEFVSNMVAETENLKRYTPLTAQDETEIEGLVKMNIEIWEKKVRK